MTGEQKHILSLTRANETLVSIESSVSGSTETARVKTLNTETGRERIACYTRYAYNSGKYAFTFAGFEPVKNEQ